MELDDNADDIMCYEKDPAKDDWKMGPAESILIDAVKLVY